MFISDQHRVVFVHIPKTAGTSIIKGLRSSLDGVEYPGNTLVARGKNHLQQLLGRPSFKKHSLATDIISVRPELTSYFKFAFVRSPHSWVASLYQFIKYSDISPDTGKRFQHVLFNKVAPMSFTEFVIWVTEYDGLMNLPSRRHSSFCRVRPVLQKDWLCDLEGNLLVDYVGHLEHLENDWREIVAKVNLDAPSLSWENKGKGVPDVYYTEQLDSLVRGYFEKDFQTFGYQL